MEPEHFETSGGQFHAISKKKKDIQIERGKVTEDERKKGERNEETGNVNEWKRHIQNKLFVYVNAQGLNREIFERERKRKMSLLRKWERGIFFFVSHFFSASYLVSLFSSSPFHSAPSSLFLPFCLSISLSLSITFPFRCRQNRRKNCSEQRSCLG